MSNYGDGPSWPEFPPAICEALFEAVDIDDVVDPEVSLPHPISLAGTADELQRCFALCLQFWRQGFSRDELLDLVKILQETADLNASQRRDYKLIRAKYKHLRFALMLYRADHKVPKLFGATVAIMGHLQDSFRNDRRRATRAYTWFLRLLLTRPIWDYVRRRVAASSLTTAGDYLVDRQRDMDRLRDMLKQQFFTGTQFHTMRKIVSKQVSFYDTLRSLEPNEHDYKMSRYLSAINGLMGSRHDDMVEMAGRGERAYNSLAPLDDDIRVRLETLVEAIARARQQPR